ncbi:MAG: MmgE/PrpD family protein [Chloroflexota bacterium]
MAQTGVSRALAEMVANLKYEDLPADVVQTTKNDILDTIGVIVAASTQAEEPRGLIELVIESGGKEESSIIPYGNKVPCYMAAFANGSMGHALDYDDMAYPIGHVGVSTVPAALAICERIGRVGGKELLTAVATGSEVFLRLGEAVGSDAAREEWFLTPVLGVFGSAASSGRLLGLSSKQLLSAFGIALSQAAGSKQIGVGGRVRATYPAFPAKAGVLSSLMAGKGVTASDDSFEGKAGLFRVYFHDQYDASRLLTGLGKTFGSKRIGFKPWGACGHIHMYIDAAIQLVKKHRMSIDSIEAVIPCVSPYLLRFLCEPLEERRRPANGISAKFSIPFTVAVAIARQWVSLADFTPEGLRNAEVLELAGRVEPQVGPDVGRVEIRTRDGKRYSEKVAYPLGFPENPLSNQQIEAKFRECLSFSASPLPEGTADRVIGLVGKLEELEDVRDIIKLVTP